jgi:hypothetical protein
MSEPGKIKYVSCNECGGRARKHEVIHEHQEGWSDNENGIFGSENYEILKCMGCDTVRFRSYSLCSEDRDPETGEWALSNFRVYPDAPKEERRPVDFQLFPPDVAKMYLETIKCFNAGSATLAGGGLRAIVEAICKDKGIKVRSLEGKIDELVVQGFLAKNQADLLHEERYIGNDALHEMKTPTARDLEDGLTIIEGLLSTIYVLPVHAGRLKKKRASQIPAPSVPKVSAASSPPKAIPSAPSKAKKSESAESNS